MVANILDAPLHCRNCLIHATNIDLIKLRASPYLVELSLVGLSYAMRFRDISMHSGLNADMNSLDASLNIFQCRV
jgi:hypothetical protein